MPAEAHIVTLTVPDEPNLIRRYDLQGLHVVKVHAHFSSARKNRNFKNLKAITPKKIFQPAR
jgi:hypothetical protein